MMRIKALGANLPSVVSFCTGSLAAARSGRSLRRLWAE
jgi:hypothetical protein